MIEELRQFAFTFSEWRVRNKLNKAADKLAEAREIIDQMHNPECDFHEMDKRIARWMEGL